MGSQGFRNIAGNPFVYQEDVRSAAFGLDASAQKWKLVVSSTVGALPTGTAQLTIDPSTNGNVTIDPNGTGNLSLASGHLDIAAGNTLLPATAYQFGSGLLKIGGYKAIHMLGGNTNIWVGDEVANSRGTGFYQTCTYNVGVGYSALGEIWVNSNYNTAIGANALATAGDASGSEAIVGNTCIGYNSMAATNGGNNYCTCIGYNTLAANVPSSYAVAIGYNAGSGVGGAGTQGSSCIYIMNAGGNETNKIRIGTQGTGNGQQDACYIAGIYASSVGATNGVMVIDNAHKLGSLSSLTVPLGGTGAATLTSHGLLLGAGTSAVTALAEASNGQIPIGSTGNNPTLATITAGTNMTVTNGAGSITLSQTTVAITDQTDSYTLALTDAGKLVRMNKATANTLTIPKNSVVAFPVGTYILIEQLGAGQTTISPVDGDVTLRASESLYHTYGQYSLAALIKTDTDTWLLFGDIS